MRGSHKRKSANERKAYSEGVPVQIIDLGTVAAKMILKYRNNKLFTHFENQQRTHSR
jgi:hypothetical protein